MTRRFTAHEARPIRGARPKAPAPVAAELGKANVADKPEMSGKVGQAREIGGPSGPEPTRYGDWERKGICVDF